MRRSYRYDEATGKMVEYTNSWSRKEAKSAFVQGDIQAFVSPINGEVISDRGQLRRHMKIHGVTNPSDYKDHFEKKKRERELYNSGVHPKQIAERREAASDAYEKVRNNRIAEGTWRC